jgi:hypothetical protein
MGEVYIRTQDREGLYRLGGDYAYVGYFEDSTVKEGSRKKEIKHTIMISSGVLEELGVYESKERCIEILDEIQAVCSKYLYAEGSNGYLRGSVAYPPMATVIPQVYQMPEK